MFMTAIRIKIEGKPLLKLKIHECDKNYIPFFDSLGVDQLEDVSPNCRYAHIHNQEDFLSIRSAILERFKVIEEKGPRVFLEVK